LPAIEFDHFLILVLTVVGIYEALNISGCSVPHDQLSTHHYRCDNGDLPIEQMQVTITRPIEEAVNIRSPVSTRFALKRVAVRRRSALFFNWT